MLRAFFLQLLLVSVCFGGGSKQYAHLYVHARCNDSEAPTQINVYDGSSGLFLGRTPFYVYYQKKRKKAFPAQSFLARDGDNGSAAYWQVVNILNWGKSEMEAGSAAKKNEVLFRVSCPD